MTRREERERKRKKERESERIGFSCVRALGIVRYTLSCDSEEANSDGREKDRGKREGEK
jgi:hypothetical protein